MSKYLADARRTVSWCRRHLKACSWTSAYY